MPEVMCALPSPSGDRGGPVHFGLKQCQRSYFQMRSESSKLIYLTQADRHLTLFAEMFNYAIRMKKAQGIESQQV